MEKTDRTWQRTTRTWIRRRVVVRFCNPAREAEARARVNGQPGLHGIVFKLTLKFSVNKITISRGHFKWPPMLCV